MGRLVRATLEWALWVWALGSLCRGKFTQGRGSQGSVKKEVEMNCSRAELSRDRPIYELFNFK